METPFELVVMIIAFSCIGLKLWLARWLSVIGIDMRSEAVDIIFGGRIHIFEPRLGAAHRKMTRVRNPRGNGRLAQQIAGIVTQSL